jgi:hypothetical protein
MQWDSGKASKIARLLNKGYLKQQPWVTVCENQCCKSTGYTTTVYKFYTLTFLSYL